jgi:hypothetical protein
MQRTRLGVGVELDAPLDGLQLASYQVTVDGLVHDVFFQASKRFPFEMLELFLHIGLCTPERKGADFGTAVALFHAMPMARILLDARICDHGCMCARPGVAAPTERERAASFERYTRTLETWQRVQHWAAPLVRTPLTRDDIEDDMPNACISRIARLCCEPVCDIKWKVMHFCPGLTKPLPTLGDLLDRWSEAVREHLKFYCRHCNV